MKRWQRVTAAIATVLLFAVGNFVSAYRIEQVRNDSDRRVCSVVNNLRRAVIAGQTTAKNEPLVIPPGTPPYIESILTQANQRGDKIANQYLATLRDEKCEVG